MTKGELELGVEVRHDESRAVVKAIKDMVECLDEDETYPDDCDHIESLLRVLRRCLNAEWQMAKARVDAKLSADNGSAL